MADDEMLHAGDDDTPPAELKSLDRRLLADGARWRAVRPASAEFLRQVEEFGRAARQERESELAAAREHTFAGDMRIHDRGEMMMHETTTHDEAPDPQAHPPRHAPHPRRAVRWVGQIAALLILALLAVVFYTLLASRGGSGPASAPSPTAQTHGKWQTIASLPFVEAPQGPAIAPSDPNTLYEATLAPVKLRRTTDQGAHWTDLHVPGDTSNLESFQVFVSPLDAKMVFVTLTSRLPPQSQASACPTIMASQSPSGAAAMDITMRSAGAAPLAEQLPQSGQIPCSLQYYSSDGGASWKQLILPIRAALVNRVRMFGLPYGDVLSAQGNRLYAAAGCGPLCSGPSNDIVTSADGGAHWVVADQQIRAAGHYVCDLSAAPSGSDVFAITATESCGNESAPPLYLWLSADAGAHWTKVGRLPANGWQGMAVVSQPSGQPLLYIQLTPVTAQSHMDAVTDGPTHLMVSADGGNTWTAAPASGIAGPAESSSGPLCVLSNGMVIEYFGDPTTAALYGWKLGETTWQMVATPFKGDLRQLIVARQGESDVLLAVTSGKQGITIQSYLP
jgi:hypothetical protein